jgi:hypothetical protein
MTCGVQVAWQQGKCSIGGYKSEAVMLLTWEDFLASLYLSADQQGIGDSWQKMVIKIIHA